MFNKISIIGNIKIDNPTRFSYLLSSIESLLFLNDSIDKFMLNIESIDQDSLRYIAYLDKLRCKFNSFVLTYENDYYDKVYNKMLDVVKTKYFLHFEEDHFCVIDDTDFIDKLLNFDFQVMPVSFFYLCHKRFKVLQPFYEDQFCKIFDISKVNYDILINANKQYFIGNNAIFNIDFGKRYWSRKNNKNRPHNFEMKPFKSDFIHKKLLPKKEILCSIDDRHKIPKSELLKRDNDKFNKIYHNKYKEII